MKNLAITTAIFLLIILAACTAEPTQPLETARPSATVMPPTAVPNQPTYTETPGPTPTVTPPTPQPPEPENLALYDTPLPTWTPYSTPTPEPTNTVELQPFIETDVPYVIPARWAEIYTGPGYDYDQIDYLAYPDTAQVTGQSLDREWWRILCPDGTVGNCWVSSLYVDPVSAPTLDEIMPDPATLELSSETTIPSPDGRWTATASSSEEVAIADLFNLYYAKVTITDGTTNWTPVAEWRRFGLELSPPRLITWSADSRYLYYTQIPPLDGCYYFVNGYYLTRVDTTDGSTQEILQGYSAYNLSISPDTAWVAFVAGGSGLYVKQLEPLGGYRLIPFTEESDFTGTDEIYWSADSKTVVLTITSSPCNDFETTSIVRVDIETGTLTTLIASDSRRFFIKEWPDPAQPLLRLVAGGGNFWWLNIETGELTAE